MKFSAFWLLAFAAFGSIAPAYAQAAPDDNSIACVEKRLVALKQSEAGRVRLQTVTPLTLGEECGADHKWTSRKSTAASIYAVATILQTAGRQKWEATEYAPDLPDRLKRRMTLGQVNELVLQGNKTFFSQILAEELAKTGSKLHADDRVDNLSMADSRALGEKIGAVLIGLFMCEEFQKFYDDPTHQSPDLIKLMTALSPSFADIATRLR